MTGESIGEIRSALTHVAEQLETAYRHLVEARARIGDAVAVLTALDGQHTEPLVPPELRRAAAELDRGLGLIGGGSFVVTDLEGRL